MAQKTEVSWRSSIIYYEDASLMQWHSYIKVWLKCLNKSLSTSQKCYCERLFTFQSLHMFTVTESVSLMYMVRRYKVFHMRCYRWTIEKLYVLFDQTFTTSSFTFWLKLSNSFSLPGFNLWFFPIYLFVDSGNCFFFLFLSTTVVLRYVCNLQTLWLCAWCFACQPLFSVKVLNRNIYKKCSKGFKLPNAP